MQAHSVDMRVSKNPVIVISSMGQLCFRAVYGLALLIAFHSRVFLPYC